MATIRELINDDSIWMEDGKVLVALSEAYGEEEQEILIATLKEVGTKWGANDGDNNELGLPKKEADLYMQAEMGDDIASCLIINPELDDVAIIVWIDSFKAEEGWDDYSDEE